MIIILDDYSEFMRRNNILPVTEELKFKYPLELYRERETGEDLYFNYRITGFQDNGSQTICFARNLDQAIDRYIEMKNNLPDAKFVIQTFDALVKEELIDKFNKHNHTN